MARQFTFIVNPASRGGALGKEWSDIAHRLRRDVGSFETRFTECAGEAESLARESLLSGTDAVIAVGGDGTINEVVNGFFKDGHSIAVDQHLGILPFGTGGDFRRSLNMSNNLQSAAETLSHGHTRTIDVGHVSFMSSQGKQAERYFINIASCGISGLVDQIANDSSKRLGGRASFLLASAKATLRYRNQRVRLTFDDDHSRPTDMTIHTLAVANASYFGGGMHVAPNALMDDGLFDVIAIGDLSKLEVLKLGRRIYKGDHLTMDKVSHRRAHRVHVEAIDGDEVLLDIDGEAPGCLPATFSIKQNALSIIARG